MNSVPYADRIFRWTDEAVATLRLMAADYSTKVIGEKIGASRNAVIGKCMRLGISLAGPEKQNAKPVNCKPRVRRPPAPPRSPNRDPVPSSSVERKRRYVTFPTAAPAEVAVVAVERQRVREEAMLAASDAWQRIGIPFLKSRAGQCIWPLWKGEVPIEAKLVCGLPAQPGKSYCPRCRSMAFAPPRQAKQLDDKLGITAARKAA